MNYSNISFGKNLKNLRKKSGYTRTQLARLISYSEKSIEKWEAGDSTPPISTIVTLSKLFNVTVDALVLPHTPSINYLLGIDGGGTKTEFLLTDINENEIKRVVLGASNPIDIGIENSKKVLELGITQVCKDIDYHEISVFAGIAGTLSGNYQQSFDKFFSMLGFGCYATGSDTENALETALKGKDGVAVISGTGHVAFAQHGGKRHRISGWGYLIDKGGSGYNFGVDALYSAFKYIDGRGGSKLLCELIEKRLTKPLTDSIPDIYRGGKRFIASFAPVVFEAYAQGDAEAEKIIDSNVREISEIIRTGHNYLKDTNSAKTVLCGSLCRKEAVLRQFFAKHLDNSFPLLFSTEPMINGAISLAKSNIEKYGGK